MIGSDSPSILLKGVNPYRKPRLLVHNDATYIVVAVLFWTL